MSEFSSRDEPSVIRISAEDLADPHVDDLMKRQASLRGEGGITSGRRRKWYYSSWFVFGMAGLAGSFVAWLLLEPFLDDFLYVQGTWTVMPEAEAIHESYSLGGGLQVDYSQLLAHTTRQVKITSPADKSKSVHVLIGDQTKPAGAGDRNTRFDASTLKEGEQIGVWVTPQQIITGRGTSIVVGEALFVDTSPPPSNATAQTLEEMLPHHALMNRLFFPTVAALIGLAIGAADGVICRLWRRALLSGVVGLLVGAAGGLVSGFLADLVYGAISAVAAQQSGEGVGGLTAWGFLTQLGARSLGWALAGMTAGLGQGLALRSGKLFIYGFLGGTIGGLMGGLFFDPVHFFVVGENATSGHLSRMIGIMAVGCGVGLMIGIVELLARDAWLHMVEGPLAGKEFLVFKDLMQVGSSPRSDIYLFNDEDVAERHALIRATADQYEVEALDEYYPVLVNGRPVQRGRLRHGDQIMLGKTVFTFHRRRTT